MIHAAILLACLLVGWGLSVLVLRLVHRFPRWGDRRALHQLALWSPLLALVLAGGWSVEMALTGCLMFTTTDGIATVGLMAVVTALLIVASVRESLRVVATRRRLVGVAHPMPPGAFPVPLEALSRQLGVKPPLVFFLGLDRPVAAVAGVARPVLFISRWMLENLSSEELEALVAHEIAHLKHADNLIAWLDVILLRAFAFIPPVRRAWVESLAEREEAADARAVQLTKRPLDLASALVKVAEQAPEPGEAQAGLAYFAGEASLLERRIERLLASPGPDIRPWGWPAVAALAVAGALPLVTAWALGFATSCLGH